MPKTVHLAGKPPQFEVDVPGDGTCLFYSVSFAYLLPVAKDSNLFRTRFIKLFGEEVQDSAEENRQRLLKYDGSPGFISKNTGSFEILVNAYFRKRVVDFMRANEAELRNFISDDETFAARMTRMADASRKEWGDHLEIEAISRFLTSRIHVYHYHGEFLMPHPIHGEQHTNEIHLVHTTSDERIKYAKNHYHYIIDQQFVPGYDLAAEEAAKRRLAEEAAAKAAMGYGDDGTLAKLRKEKEEEEALLNRARLMSETILNNDKIKKAKAAAAEANKAKDQNAKGAEPAPPQSAGALPNSGTAVLQFSSPTALPGAPNPLAQPVTAPTGSSPNAAAAVKDPNNAAAAEKETTPLANKFVLDKAAERILTLLKQEGYKSRVSDSIDLGILKPVIQDLMDKKLELSATNLHDVFKKINLVSPAHQMILSVLGSWMKKDQLPDANRKLK
jgi:hypothetical protein